ncbi:MAG: hypothetical protein OXG57_15540 [Acidimicrobiaceae bacterium]|nr:hypothetical protein [Acidimicrobiaceae bacterium]MCY3609847.1 hypothetical protein [Acidimicrobiaceae bacterium]
MLAPDNRHLLASALHPPDGHEFDCAMAVTYSLDLSALLAVPVALAGGDPPDADGPDSHAPEAEQQAPTSSSLRPRSRPEPVSLLAAVKAHARNITVFAQAGQIAVPRARRAFAFVEDCVVPVTAPLNGVVHAKVWVLRYRPTGTMNGDPKGAHLRIVTGSRNLTFDASWDTVAFFDSASESGHGSAPLSGAAELFEGLLGNTPSERLAVAHRRRVTALCDEIRGQRFALPAGVDNAHVHVLGIPESGTAGGGEQPSPFPVDARRALVISPFVSHGFFDSVLSKQSVELVSRSSELRRIDAKRLYEIGHVGYVHAFDDGGVSEDFGPDETDSVDIADDPARRLGDLHAKVFAFDLSHCRSRLFFGSANATYAAFNRNVEVLFEFEGARRFVGIEALVGPPGAVGGAPITLRRLFVPYPLAEADEPVDDSMAHALDEARRHLAASLLVSADVAPDGDQWMVRYRSAEALDLPDTLSVDDVREGDISGDWTIVCRPLSPVVAKPAELGRPLEASFGLPLADISAWLELRITAPDGRSTATLVPVRLTGLPTGFESARDTAVMRSLIGNGERFLQYLLALLSGRSDEYASIDTPADANREADTSAVGGTAPLSIPTLEVLLRTLHTNPERLRELKPLVASFLGEDGAAPDTATALNGFGDLWNAVLEIAESPEGKRPSRSKT